MILLHILIAVVLLNNKLIADAPWIALLFLYNAVGPQKARQFHSNVENICVASFNIKGAVNYGSVPGGQTVNKHYYTDTLRHLREDLRRTRAQNLNSRDWVPQYDNSSTYSTFCMLAFMAKGKMIVVPYPTFSPDLVPCDVFLPPKLNMALTGWWLNKVKMIQAKSQEALVEFHAIDFRKRFERWCDLWVCCISPKETSLKGTTWIRR
jgi:hypothetical protein